MQNINFIKKYNESIAYSHINKPIPIDIILSAALAFQIFNGQRIKGENVTAYETYFGWVFTGVGESNTCLINYATGSQIVNNLDETLK